MLPNRIDVGDEVEIHFFDYVLRGIVTYIPQNTGDSWIIKDGADRIHYVQTFTRMLRLC